MTEWWGSVYGRGGGGGVHLEGTSLYDHSIWRGTLLHLLFSVLHLFSQVPPPPPLPLSLFYTSTPTTTPPLRLDSAKGFTLN